VRVAFAGSPAAALPVLEALAASPHEVALVITQPDRPRGRALAAAPTAVAEAAEGLGLPVIRPATINDPDVLARLEQEGIGALTVAAFGQILREPLLSLWPCLNVHYSLLPAYRGASPVERALMDGRRETGVTIMRMDAGLDTGPIALREPVAIGSDDDAGTLTARLADVGGRLLVAGLDLLDAGRLELEAQPDDGVSLAPKLTETDRVLDFERSAQALADQVRALAPRVGAVCWIDGERFKVWRARALDGATPSGLSVDGDRLLAGCGEGTLELLELQPPSRGRMAAAAFVRGWRGALELGRR